MSRFRVARAGMVVVAASAMAGLALAADEKDAFDRAEWEPVLRQQVKSARGCDIKEILFANILELGKQKVLEGRLQCFDGREFTFTRKVEHQKFEFELCAPTVC